MRRFVTAPFRYLAELARETARGWNRFFFTPADPTSLGLMRVVVGAILFWNLLNLGWDLHDYLGSDGWIDPAAVRQYDAGHPLRWSFWGLVPDSLLRPTWVICLVVLGLYTAGLYSRVTAVLAWVIVVSWVRRAPVALFGFDQAVSTLTLYLAVTGASGQAVSLDRFLSRWRFARGKLVPPRNPGDQRPRVPLPPGAPVPTISANLALRLIQLHFCLIYGMAGLAKLQGGAWWGGMAIWGMLASAEFRVVDFNWLVLYPVLLNVLTHTALALEIGYPALIWVRPLRPLILALVVVLHVGIALSAPGLTEFALAMIAGNLAFVSGGWLRSLATGVDPSEPAVTVLYDGGCPRCRASIALLSAADPDRVVDPVDLTRVDVSTVHPSLTREVCMRAMHLVSADGRVCSGYDAVVGLARCLPMFWPAALFGSLPGVTWVGRRAYNAIAASRPRDQVCNDEVCGIHPPATRGR
ncbi:MAG: DCC1-like thiol-disulfide oxidoreductase family protein [Isosphaeraceae bacterium]